MEINFRSVVALVLEPGLACLIDYHQRWKAAETKSVMSFFAGIECQRQSNRPAPGKFPQFSRRIAAGIGPNDDEFDIVPISQLVPDRLEVR